MHRRIYLRALAVGLCAVLMSVAPIAAQTSTGTTDKSKKRQSPTARR